jgi:hypothetical protein
MSSQTILPPPVDDDAILAEHAQGHARVMAEFATEYLEDVRSWTTAWPPAPKPVPAPVVLDDFVRQVFNGAIGDHELPFAHQEQARP